MHKAHAGDLADGDPTGKNTCKQADTNALAAFLLGAGEYSYCERAFANAFAAANHDVFDPFRAFVLNWPGVFRPLRAWLEQRLRVSGRVGLLARLAACLRPAARDAACSRG